MGLDGRQRPLELCRLTTHGGRTPQFDQSVAPTAKGWEALGRESRACRVKGAEIHSQDHTSDQDGVGGVWSHQALRSVESLRLSRWQLHGEGWVPGVPMMNARFGHTAARIGDAILVAGGGHDPAVGGGPVVLAAAINDWLMSVPHARSARSSSFASSVPAS